MSILKQLDSVITQIDDLITGNVDLTEINKVCLCFVCFFNTDINYQ